MAWRRKRSNNRRRPLRRRFARRARGGRVSRASRVSVKRAVKLEMARQIETKTVMLNPALRSLYYVASANWPANNVISLSYGGNLQVLQGAGNGQRIGNRIRHKSLTFNFVMRPRLYDVVNNTNPVPLMIRMVLFYERAAPTDDPNPTSDFFDLNNTATSIKGDPTDMIATFNTDKYRILAEKRFKLGPAQAILGPSGTTAPLYANNDYKLNIVHRWDVSKYLPKLVRYNDDSGFPSSRGVWCAIMLVPADGSPGLASNIPVAMKFWLQASYTDA